ncbi:RDD family protein [Polaromonas sp. LjRoot131]|uniref:RDD family protein n=1 Tax=Polaromonas sp. LjRoot131 TaxID=3342262 RepID=UPI003ECF51E4
MATTRLDTLYTAETPEGITLSLRPAGIVARGLAYLIDLAIRGCLFIAVAIAVGVMGKAGVAVLLLAYFALEWFYPVVFELTRSAATPGKRALGLRVVMDSGLPVTPAASLTRNLLRAADFMPALFGAGLVSMLWRDDSKRLGDLAAGTLVVFTDAVKLHGEVPLATPQAPARPLSAAEQASVLAWAGRATRLTPERLGELAALAEPVLGTGVPGSSATQRLLGVAQWLMGRREGEARR